MKRLLLLLLLPTLILAAGNAEVSPLLRRQLDAAAPDEVVGAWAYFTDKGFSTELERRDAVDAYIAAMNPDQYERRTLHRSAPGLADERDLPVHEPYLDALRPLVTNYLGTSPIANAACIEITADQLDAVAALGCVFALRPVAHCYLPEFEPATRPEPRTTDLDYGYSQIQIEQIQVDELHNAGYDGTGVTVLMLDTGFRTDHDAFAQVNLVDEYDFVNDDDDVDNEPGDPGDAWDHGTATWGALGGYVPETLIGPAYGADFLLAKTEDVSQEVNQEELWYDAGIRWGEGLGADVASSSLGYRYFDSGQQDYDYEDLDGETTVVAQVVNWARDNGMLIANAMGNDGPGDGTLISPADSDGILSCGAVDSSGSLAYFSSWGPTYDGRTKPEVCAMGLNTYAPYSGSTSSYYWFSGTSLSTPLVGGVLACLRQYSPSASVADIRQALMDTATQSGSPDNQYGWGIVQAMDAADELSSDAPVWNDLRAEREDVGALIRWSFSTEEQVLGFNLYRLAERPADALADPTTLHETDESWRRLNDAQLDPAAGAWLDTTAPTSACVYRVEALTADGRSHHSGEIALDERSETAAATNLEACFPNPARDSVSFTFTLAQAAPVELAVYDLAGRRVALVVDGELSAGRHEYLWNGGTELGTLESGVYLYSLSTPDHRESRRLVILR